MDQGKWTTPDKNMSVDTCCLPETPPPRKCPRINEYLQRSRDICGFVTPPSAISRFKARNPFDIGCPSKLQSSVISPSAFKEVNVTSEGSPTFNWSIEAMSILKPAEIEENPTNQFFSPDSETEKEAQAAITKFFSQEQILPSPCDHRKPKDTNFVSLERDKNNSVYEKKDCWTQTVLSLPPVLPEHVEKALKPFFIFTQEQNVDLDDSDNNNSSLRRKLFFNDRESSDDEEEAQALSPLGSEMIQHSPPQSGMFANYTSIQNDSFVNRSERTPRSKCSLSPINISPISNVYDRDMSFQSIKSRNKSATRLDLTAEMSIANNDDSEQFQVKLGSTGTPVNKQPFHSTKNAKDDDMDTCVVNEKSSCAGNSSAWKDSDLALKPDKLAEKDCQIYSSTFRSMVHLQQSSSQDTGYQTSSINSTESNKIEKDAVISIKKHLLRNENISNIICSTPSKDCDN